MTTEKTEPLIWQECDYEYRHNGQPIGRAIAVAYHPLGTRWVIVRLDNVQQMYRYLGQDRLPHGTQYVVMDDLDTMRDGSHSDDEYYALPYLHKTLRTEQEAREWATAYAYRLSVGRVPSAPWRIAPHGEMYMLEWHGHTAVVAPMQSRRRHCYAVIVDGEFEICERNDWHFALSTAENRVTALLGPLVPPHIPFEAEWHRAAVDSWLAEWAREDARREGGA